MPQADIDEVLEDRTPLLFASDQPTFEDKANHFSVLVPLMTIDGREFENPDAVFSNRGRVWWMLRHEHIHLAAGAGTIWSAPVEPAFQFDAANPKKDRYQAVRAHIELGSTDWVDVIDVGFDPQDLDAAFDADGLDLGRRPLTSVLLRGARSVAGPFFAEWDPAIGRTRLRALNPGSPLAWVVPRSALVRGDNLFEFRYHALQWYSDGAVREIAINLFPRKRLVDLQSSGTVMDAASDDQVIKWALQHAGYTNKDKSDFRRALDRVDAVSGKTDENPARLARFRTLCARGEKIVGASREVATMIAEQPAFAELVRKHADDLAAVRVKELVESKRKAIDTEVRQAEAQRSVLDQKIREMESDYDRRKVEQDTRLRVEHADALRTLDARELELKQGFANLRTQQGEIEERLREVVGLYETKGRELGNELLAQFPMLQRMSFGEGKARQPQEPPGRAPLPSWLDRGVARGELTEVGFLDQLRSVVSRRGFVFSDDDLVNFHVSMKVGLWTVLAGASGTGKTSLPRVYAESMGMLEEYLSIPVKPDWLDDRDVVGAFNSLTGRFEPGNSGLVDHLIAAAEDQARRRGGLYIVCLDEMNLARVEHYFASFLSVADEPLISRRKIPLYSRGVERPGEPYATYRELPVGDNVRIVGTVNVDETTHFFSPKVLDRAPVLVFDPPEIAREPQPRALAERLDVKPVHLDEWQSWVRGPDGADTNVRGHLVELDRHLHTIRAGLGFRLRNRVLAYTASARDLLTADRALDLALAHSIVPRIRASHPRFAEAIEGLRALHPTARFPRTSQFLQALQESGGAHDFFQLL